METKKCSKCSEIKEISFFSKNKKTKDGLHCSCKSCDQKKYFERRELNILKMREYKNNNPEKIKEYYEKNKENYKKYRETKREDIKKYMKDYYHNNQQKRKEYLERTKEIRNIKRKISQKIKRDTEPIYKLRVYVRNRILFYLKKNNITKKNKTFQMVGCSPQKLKEYLEKKFIMGMTWENQGEWHIDHIVPLSSAKTEEELYKLCHFTNLQPMWASDNIKKGARIIF